GLSFIYLLYLLLIPLFAEPTRTTMQGHTGRLLKGLCFTSMASLLLHIFYQIFISSLLAGNRIEANFNCSLWEKSIRQLGFGSVAGADAGNGIRLFIPDVGMCLASFGTLIMCRSLQTQPGEEPRCDAHSPDFNIFFLLYSPEKSELDDSRTHEQDDEEQSDPSSDGEELEEPQHSAKLAVFQKIASVASAVKEIIGNLITTAGKVVVTVLLGLTGIMLPSLTSLVYFLVFLGLGTCWSLCCSFDLLVFSCLCVLMAIFSAGHLLVLYLYQLPAFQELVSPTDRYISLFGVSSIIQSDCSKTWKFIVNPKLEWHHFVNPIMLLLLYYTLATLIRLWLQDPVVDPMLVVTYNAENGPVGSDHLSSSQYKVDDTDSEQHLNVRKYNVMLLRGTSLTALVTAFRFLMKQSYICALIAMMAWSISYVSWLTFVFLIWSCALWMVRDRRRYAMVSSPFMVLYGNLLIILQYIWSLELMEGVPGLFLKKEVPFRELASKIVCLLSFWLLLRQALTERREKLQQESALSGIKVDVPAEGGGDGVNSQEKEIVQVLGSMVMAMFVKYWIYLCGGMFFFVSFEGRIVMYKIIYMMLFLFGVALYQIHYEWWRRILKYFWMSVVVYTMLVLILVYTFQFDSSVHVWSNVTGMSKEKLEDLGLEKFSVPALFSRIFIPTSFLLVCILHLHYFHEHFLQLTDLRGLADRKQSTVHRLVHFDGSLEDVSMMKLSLGQPMDKESVKEKVLSEEGMGERKEEDLPGYRVHVFFPVWKSSFVLMRFSDLRNKWRLVVDRLTVLFLSFLDGFHKLQLFIWWLLELHIIKIVSSYIIWVSVKEVSLFNYVFLVSWAFALPFSQFRPLASSVCTVWTCVIIVCKMLYQLASIQPASYSKNCSMPLNYTDAQRMDMERSLLYSSPVDPAHWVGLRKFSPVLEYLRNNLVMLALLAFEVTVYRHQEFYRLRNNLSSPVPKTIFHNITRQHLDIGIVSCAKYFINYFFYKFGLETCFLLAVNVIGQRMDFYAVLHAFALIAVMYRRRRKAIAEIWPKYCCFLSAMLAFQYALCLGMPPATCTDYPWRSPSSSMDSNVIKWLYFPDFQTRPNPLFLLYDFMLLLSASLLRQVFEDENKAAVRLIAGDNIEICRELDAAAFSRHNPVPDFIYCRSYLDMLKVIIFSYLFWFVLAIIFITGTTRISIFCMGYLVACFYFLLFGGELLLKPIKEILRYWDFLIAYNVFVITMKNILSIAACGYIKALVVNSCWLIQLFSLACTIKGYSRPEPSKQCELPSDEAGIIWDSICFAFLLLQRRVFMSYYFLHVVADIRSSQILASRGAELFQITIVKAVKARIEEEKKSMDQLKRQMDRIKSRQQKSKRGKERILSLAQESQDEDKEDEVVRSGDYYLFETDSEEEEEDEEKKEAPKKTGLQVSNSRKDNIIKRIFTTVKFSWILFLALLDSFTNWLNSVSQEYIDISTVLRIERCMLTREVRKVRCVCVSVWSVSVYLYGVCLCLSISHELLALHLSPCPSGSAFTQGTMPFSRQSTQEELDGAVENVPRHSESDRPKLRKMYSVDVSDSAACSSSRYLNVAFPCYSPCHSEPTPCTTLHSRQDTTDTKEEVEQEQDPDSPSQGELCYGRGCSSEGLQEAPRARTTDEISGWVMDKCGRDEACSPLAEHKLPLSSPEAAIMALDQDIPPSYSKAVSFDRLSVCSTEDGFQQRRDSQCSRPEDTLLPPLTHELTASELLLNRMFYDEELEESEQFYQSQPPLLQLCYALYSVLVGHSEMVCYLVIIMNHMVSASLATLVLPILIFLWAMLSVPRPSKRFWMTAIVYTEVTIVIKYFFQFGFFPFNQNLELDRTKPFHPPNIIGVEKKDGYVHYDLVQLLALFFHRSILKCHGLWDGDTSQGGFESGGHPSPTPMGWEGSRRSFAAILHCNFLNLVTHGSDIQINYPHTHTHTHCMAPPKLCLCSALAGSVSSRRVGSQLSISQRSHKELLLDKLREKLLKAKAFTTNIYIAVRQFFNKLIRPEYSAVTDVYVLMFLADTVDFIIIVFGFWAFGRHTAAADITSSLSEDQVPEAFLVMVLIQFGTMVVDRALYLRKTVMGKVIFQVILVFGIHFWMFFILPGVTERRFSLNTVAQLWYFVKCIYFGLSAYQIRCGYPTRVLGNFLTKSHNYINLFLFQGFRLVPFLTELRAVMDWVWTDTTLSLSSWICVEDIYAHVFVLKCWRESEKRYPQRRGQKKKKVVKYGMGGLIVMLLIFIVWFPLLFMSLVKSVAGVVNKPLDVSVTITLGGFQPIFTMSAQQNQLKDMSEAEFVKFMNGYKYCPGALQFLEAYTSDDVTVAELEGSSNSLWTISPPSRKNLMQLLSEDDQFSVTISWSIQRNLSLGTEAELASDKHVTHLDMETRKDLIQLLNGTRREAVIIAHIFPSFIRAPSNSNAKPIDKLYEDDEYMNITLALERSHNTTRSIQEWWIVDQVSSGKINVGKGHKKSKPGLRLYVFSDKVSPPSLGFLAGYGIMGLYASVVLVIGKFVREFFSGISRSIMFEELPCVERILKLCTDIFLVRETGELELEEELCAKLIFLYRSPETMIKWTRGKTL
uniref:Piezo-type mechanosensitive ion channel component 2a, tandem duplicate 2 n=1 Tax=Paramormyrops kingsleyae TaxID=1676925 RepID=A0A3B3RZ37_9TELE